MASDRPVGRIWVIAFVVAFLASLAEIRQVAQVWLACELDSAGSGWGFLLFHLPVLVTVQTLAVGAAATALARRPGLAAVAVAAVLAGLAYLYFRYCGLPVTNAFCRAPEPAWWP